MNFSRDHRAMQESTAELVRSFEAREPQPSLFSPAELPPRLWTLDEVAEFLQMSKDWVRDHATRRQPRIPSIRLGGRRAVLRFRPADIKRFVNEHLCQEEPK
jgi:hypothetical protein